MEKSHRGGVNDGLNCREVAAPISKRKMPMKQLLRVEALAAFVEWQKKGDKVPY